MFKKIRSFFIKDEKRIPLGISKVKPGDFILFNWKNFTTGTGAATVLNNSPVWKMIVLKVDWSDGSTSYLSEKYSSKKFIIFDIMNPQYSMKMDMSLEEKLQECLREENYEEAERIRKMMNK